MSRPIVECIGVTKRFGAVCAVEQITLALEPGKVMALVGPSGAGKTTLLRLIAGFEAPDAGSILLGGRPVVGKGTWVSPEDRRVGIVFQDYALFPHMTVEQNVAFGLKGLDRHDRAQRVQETLAMARIDRLAKRYPHELSGGEQQRVALARALAPRPLVLLLDEPFSNLDPQLRVKVREEVKVILQANGVTAVFVTHDQQEALYMGDLVAVLNQGLVEQVDTPERIFHAPRSRFVATFMGIADFLPVCWGGESALSEIGALPAPPGLRPEPHQEVMVRPDDIALWPSETGQGRIVAQIFQGAFYLYQVALPSGAVVHSLQSHTADYPVGTRVEVRLDSGHQQLFFANGRVLDG